MVNTPGAREEMVVVTLPREIDMANPDRVGEDVDAVFGPGVGVVVAGHVGHQVCGTSGIYALVMAHKRARASYTGFQVVVGPGEVRRVLEILRLDTVLAIYPRLGVALLASDRKPA